MTDGNIYRPYLMRIEKVVDEAPAIKTFRLKFVDENEGRGFRFKVGQFGEYSVFGEGECTFCIARAPNFSSAARTAVTRTQPPSAPIRSQ